MRRKQERLEKMKFGIVSDSSCDLVERYTEEEKVSIVPFYVSFDGEHYLKEGKEAKITDFYQKMADNPDCYPKTSMPFLCKIIWRFSARLQSRDFLCCAFV